MVFEPGFDEYEALMPAFADKLRDFASFNGCERFTVEGTDPAHARELLERALDTGE